MPMLQKEAMQVEDQGEELVQTVDDIISDVTKGGEDIEVISQQPRCLVSASCCSVGTAAVIVCNSGYLCCVKLTQSVDVYIKLCYVM